jgi:hypothetical protein
LFVAQWKKQKQMQAERFTYGEGCGVLRPVLPFELSFLLPRDFVQIVHNQKQRLRLTWDDQKLEDMGAEFRSYKNFLHNDEQNFRIVSHGDATKGFIEYWADLQHRFPLVYSFCGGMATIFPET